MSLQKKQLLKRVQKKESSTAKKTCTSLASECIMKAPKVLLYDIKSELDHQNKKQNIKQRDRGRHSDQSSQECPPDDGSAHSKLSPSLPAHSELLASNIDITYHHQQQDTTEKRSCTSLQIKSLKIPVAPPFLSNVQPETRGEESANEYDRAQHQSQKLLKIDEQEGQSVNNTYTSLAGVCKWKQPVIKLLRIETQLDHKEKKRSSKLDSEQYSYQKLQKTDQPEGPSKRKQPMVKLLHVETKKKSLDHQEKKWSSKLDSEQYSDQCTDFARKRDRQKCSQETVCLMQPVVQLTRLNMEAKSQVERQATNEGASAHHQDHVQPPESAPLNVQPENWEEQEDDDSDSDQFDEQCTDFSRKHDRQKCGLDTASLMQPVVQLTRLNIENQVERQTMNDGVSAHHQDHVQPPDSATLNVQPENREEQAEDDSDSDQFDEQDLNKISAYERERLKNLKANAKFLKSLKLLEDASTLCRRQKKKRVYREKPPCNLVNRESRRLKGCSASEDVRQMLPTTDMDNSEWISFQNTWKSSITNQFARPTSFKCKDLTSYADSLSKLRQDKRTGICTVRSFVSAIAVHPSNTHSLVAAGDSFGNVVLWDRNRQSPREYVFPLHSCQTGVVSFSPSNSQHLLSLGLEGTIFRGDISRSVFEQICYAEKGLTSFDFLSDSGSVLLVGHSDSRLSVVDCRTNTYDVCGRVCLANIRTVSVHPLKKDLCVVAGIRNALIYDVRKLSMDKTQPLMSFLEGRGCMVVSATFSPGTGKYILASFRDRSTRVFTIEDFKRNTYPVNFEQNTHPFNSLYGYRKTSIYKSLSPVTWDPKQENCFAEGHMSSGQINFFHVKGQAVGSLFSSTCVPYVLAIHPTRNLVVVGTQSKTLRVWEE